MYERPVCKSRSIIIFISCYEQGKTKFTAFQKIGNHDFVYYCVFLLGTFYPTYGPGTESVISSNPSWNFMELHGTMAMSDFEP